MYRHSAVERGAATLVGDYKKANKHYDLLMGALVEFRKRGAQGNKALLGLLDNEEQSARCWAATLLFSLFAHLECASSALGAGPPSTRSLSDGASREVGRLQSNDVA